MLPYLHLLEEICTMLQHCHLAVWRVIGYTTHATIQALRTEQQEGWIFVPSHSRVCFSLLTHKKDGRQLNKPPTQPKQRVHKHDVLRIRETDRWSSVLLSSFRKLVCQKRNDLSRLKTLCKYAEILSWSRCYIIPSALDNYLEITFYRATILRSCVYKCGNFTPRCLRIGSVRDPLARWKGTWIGLVAPYFHVGYVGPFPIALDHLQYCRWSKRSTLSTDITDLQSKDIPTWRMLPFCFVCLLSIIEILSRMSITCNQ